MRTIREAWDEAKRDMKRELGGDPVGQARLAKDRGDAIYVWTSSESQDTFGADIRHDRGRRSRKDEKAAKTVAAIEAIGWRLENTSTTSVPVSAPVGAIGLFAKAVTGGQPEVHNLVTTYTFRSN